MKLYQRVERNCRKWPQSGHQGFRLDEALEFLRSAANMAPDGAAVTIVQTSHEPYDRNYEIKVEWTEER